MQQSKEALILTLYQIKRLEQFDKEFSDFLLKENIVAEDTAIRLIAEFKEIVTHQLALAQQLSLNS